MYISKSVSLKKKKKKEERIKGPTHVKVHSIVA